MSAASYLRGQTPPAVLRGVIGEEHLADLDLRNKLRAQQLIQRLGERYCCHPKYTPTKPLKETV